MVKNWVMTFSMIGSFMVKLMLNLLKNKNIKTHGTKVKNFGKLSGNFKFNTKS